jgi:D-alanyl-lipoteichoic acid acyltransferase DltB (MBOAT superfamily)
MAWPPLVGRQYPAVNFVSFEFLGFLAAVYLLHWALPHERGRKWLLTVASYIFYAAWDWRFCFLMLFVTANAFAAGRLLASSEDSRRKVTLLASIAVDLATLGFFKYYNFFASNVAVVLADLGLPSNPRILQIVLPVGISFYTFHAISYVVDVYRGKVTPETSLVNLASCCAGSSIRP